MTRHPPAIDEPEADTGCAPVLATRAPRKGRGAVSNASGRFEAMDREAVDDGWGSLDEEPLALRTTLTVDASRSVISRNQSPDVPFEQSINPYRGCEHGCIYCFARPTHAWLGLSPGLDFESRLFYKPDAAHLLRRELARPGYQPKAITLGANTDPYQPVERRLGITRGIIEVLAACDHAVGIVTKSALVERDIDLLAPMAARGLASVCVSITTLDRTLARRMEPRAAAPERRLRSVRMLADAGIPVTVLVAPVIPVLNDPEIEHILETVARAGAVCAGYVLLRLPLEIAGLFHEWLHAHYPLKAEHVMARVRDTRGGRDYDARFGTRMRGEGVYADLIAARFKRACNRLALARRPVLDETAFRPPAMPAADGGRQMQLL